MPWGEVTRVSLREEFVQMAMQPDVNKRELCRRFKISPKTGYKWLRRYKLTGREGLVDGSRQPHQSPSRTKAVIEQQIIELRAESRNCWGGRKLSRQLLKRDGVQLAPSTISSILRRAGLINPALAAATPYQRFERSGPNELWQMDFKGHFPLVNGQRCHPLTVLDDHSRFVLIVSACANERADTVQALLTATFRHCG